MSIQSINSNEESMQAMYPNSLLTEAEYTEILESFSEDLVDAAVHNAQMTLFRTERDGEFENPFLISNEEGWVREADILGGVSPRQWPAELLFRFGNDDGFENPFLNSSRVGWVREADIEEDVSPCTTSTVKEVGGPGEYDYFADWDGDYTDQPGAESYFSDDSDMVDEHEPGVYVVDEELASLYSELSQPDSWIVGDDEEFTSYPGAWVVGNDGELTSPYKTRFVEDRIPIPTINDLESLIKDLEDLISDQICANSFLEMDVDALIDDVQALNWQLVDNDSLRGACDFDLTPHSLRSGCGCYHCSRDNLDLDQNECHDLKFCPCPNCLIVREKAKRADRLRAEEKADKAWTTKLLKKLRPKSGARDAEGEQMLDEEEDKENTASMFDLVRRRLRSQSK